MHSNEREKHENNLIIWVIPLLLALVGFGFVAAMAELLTFMWPELKLHFYLGFLSIAVTFLGYFATAKPESFDKKRSRIPEFLVLVVLSKLYTMFVLSMDVFLSHLKLTRFLEVNFIFAFVLLYFVWVLARTAGNLAKSMTESLVDMELKRQSDESYVGIAERESGVGLKMLRLLFLPMVVLLIFVVFAEQSFQERMLVASFLRLKVNIFGAILAASTIAMSTLVLYLRKNRDWDREKADVEKNLGFKWVVWSLVFVLIFSVVATLLPDDLSPVYFYVPNAIKAVLPFMHTQQQGREPIFQERQSEPIEFAPEERQQIVRTGNAFLVSIAAGLRIVLFLLISSVLIYHLVKAFRENSDELPALIRNIIKTFNYFYEMIKKLFIKVTPRKTQYRKTITEQIEQLFKRRKVIYNQVNLNEVRKLYAELLIEAEQKGITREAYSTASEFAKVLEDLFPERVEEIVDLTKIYEDARYNKDPDESTSHKARSLFSAVFQTIKGYSNKLNR
ncbi:MAG: DUF4129 domain-containing protein [Firmicutes bacterium]|nr:DUF4129 domain-containing protein [Bacillota bacterium]